MRHLFSIILYFLILPFIYCNEPNINKRSIDVADIKQDYFNLIIPKINLNQKVYKYNDKRNNVDKGVYLAKNYEFKKNNGSLILASHSGNSSISYFKDLNKVNIKDQIFIISNKNIYLYIITEIYKINKNGKFKYINDDKYLYLITCDKKNKKKQIVVRANLVKITKKSNI